MPGRAPGEPALLEEDHIGLVVAGEMVGGGTADDAAADDDDRRLARHAHQLFGAVDGIDPAEAVEIVHGVGGIVEVELGMNLRNHAPHGFAQERGALHRPVALVERRVRIVAEIGGQHPALLLGVELAVGGEIGEVEERRVEAGIVPVDQPDALAVIEEIAGDQVVVAEDQFDRSDGQLQARRDVDEVGETGDVAALRIGERVGVVADDVEDPEGEGRTAEVAGNLAVNPLDQRDDLLQAGEVAQVGRRAGPPVDIAHHHDARLAVNDLRRNPRLEGGLAGRALVEAHDLVDDDIVADPHDVALAGVLDQEIDVGDAADEPFRLHRPGPQRELAYPLFGGDFVVGRDHSEQRARATGMDRAGPLGK